MAEFSIQNTSVEVIDFQSLSKEEQRSVIDQQNAFLKNLMRECAEKLKEDPDLDPLPFIYEKLGLSLNYDPKVYHWTYKPTDEKGDETL